MTRRRLLLSGATAAALAAGAAAAGALLARAPRPMEAGAMRRLLAAPLAPPGRGMAVFHLGHSLVGRDMPAMLAQLAPEGHRWAAQLGWGASLRDHWRGPRHVAGFAAENAHPAFAEAGPALDSGGFDAVVLTEMVELRDAIRWHAAARHLARWAARARAGNPEARLYLYETWHRLDDPAGWLDRLDADYAVLWQAELLAPALARLGGTVPVRLIPAGQALARFVRALEARGGAGGMADRRDLFARGADGAVDPIHLNDRGAYLVALTHVAVLYHRDPRGLPHRLRRADGTPAEAPPQEAAALMQAAVAETVAGEPMTGVERLA